MALIEQNYAVDLTGKTGMKWVGTIFSLYRHKRGLTQMEVAEHLDVSQPYWARVETGKRDLSMRNFARACWFLDVAPADVIRMLKEAKGERDG